MQRATKVQDTQEEEKVLWIRQGGSTRNNSSILIIDGVRKMIKNGQKFFAKPSEIPVAFRDVIVKIDGDEPSPAPRKVVRTTYVLDPLQKDKEEDEQMYNILESKTGKVVNQEPLDKETATQFINDLQ